MSYGDPRMTRVIDVDEPAVMALCKAFPDPEWYVSEDTAREAVRLLRQFNVVHLPPGNKIDFMIISNIEWEAQQLQRRQAVRIEGFRSFAAHPKDIILAKLQYFREGHSDKHLTDISSMRETSGHLIDRDSVTRWADKLGVLDTWNVILQRLDQSDPSP